MRFAPGKLLSSHSLIARLGVFMAVLGPGIIAGSVDNDAGGITTYSVAGAAYGYNLIWTLLPAFAVLLVVQEMNARMGIVTGKGLADLIRENFGVRTTFFIFLGMLIADLGNTTTEFAGVAGSMEIFGVSKYISVPLSALLVWLLAVKSDYRTAEKIFLIFSVSLLSYIFSALLARPDWKAIGHAMVHPQITFSHDYLLMVLGIIGTTIAPWMQFYMQSAVIEKQLRIEDYGYSLLDIVAGCIATVAVAFFIMVACAATLHPHGIAIEKASDAAMSLRPLAGAFAAELFAFGLFIASIFSATILPLAAAFYICEAFGFESGIDRKLHEAPEFYRLYTGMIVFGALIVLIPQAPLIKITLWSQVINGLILPVILVAMIRLVNKPDVMGAHVNRPLVNFVGWATVIVISLLSLALLIFSLV